MILIDFHQTLTESALKTEQAVRFTVNTYKTTKPVRVSLEFTKDQQATELNRIGKEHHIDVATMLAKMTNTALITKERVFDFETVADAIAFLKIYLNENDYLQIEKYFLNLMKIMQITLAIAD